MSRLYGNAMVNDDGTVFQPPTVEDARRIETEHHARIASPQLWTLGRCAETSAWVRYVDGIQASGGSYTQCARVAGHSGEHRAEVTW